MVIKAPGNNEIIIDFLDSEEAANNYIKFRDFKRGALLMPEGQDPAAQMLVNPSNNSEPQYEDIGGETVESYNMATLPFSEVHAMEEIVFNCLSRGPLTGKSLLNTRVILSGGRFTKTKTSHVMIEMSTNNILFNAFKGASPAKMEPIMDIKIFVPEQYTQTMVNDLVSLRGGSVSEIITPDISKNKRKQNEILGTISLEKTIGYSNVVRSLTHVTTFY